MEALIIAALMSCLVWAGLLCIVAGLSRSKNAASAMLRSLACFCAAILAFYLLGNPLTLQPGNPVAGFNWVALNEGFGVQGLLYLTAMLPATALVVGALHERSRFVVAPVLACGLCGIVCPLAMHWIHAGWLGRLGCFDLAGAATVWLPASVFALLAAYFVGPRQGKYNIDGSANGIVGHSMTLAFAGLGILLAGWLISAGAWSRGLLLVRSLSSPLLGAAVGGTAAMLFSRYKYGKIEAFLSIIGVLSGLVSVSTAGGLLPAWAALIVAGLTAWLSLWASIRLDVRLRVDDPISAVTTFGVPAVVGMLAPAFFINSGFAIMAKFLGVQLLAVVVMILLSALVALPLLLAMRKCGCLRASEADEYDGLDLAEHDVNAYPDFQQTMIKSYHLREA